MKQRMKRTIAQLLAVIMVVAMMPVSGYGAVSNSDVFQIGDEGYGSWSEVETVLKDGDIVQVLKDTGNVVINESAKDFTLDLNENTLKTTISYAPLTIVDVGHLTIKNGTITTGLTGYNTVNISAAECVTFENVTISHTGGKYAIDLTGGTVEFVTAEVSTTGSKAVNKASGATVTWGRQTEIPTGWSSAASFIASLTADFQAILDGTGYARVDDALADAQDGSEVVLQKDVIGANINDTGKSFTFDLNEKTVGFETATSVFIIDTSGSVLVKNGTVIGEEADYGVLTVEKGNVTMEDVSVRNLDKTTYAVYNEAGTINIKSGSFESSNSSEGAIFTVAGGTTTVDTGSIVEPADWETASCFTATYDPIVEVRDSETATTGTKYADIETAIDEGAGKYLYLLKDVLGAKTFAFGEETTFDLGGNTLSMKSGSNINIYKSVTLQNGTINLLGDGYICIQPYDSEDTVTFDNLTVTSESSVLAEVTTGSFVLGAGDYEASEGIKTGFDVYESATLTIKDGYATDLPEEEWDAFTSMHIGTSIEDGKYVITGLEESYIYQGEAVTPALTVKSVTTDRPLAAQQYNAVFSDNNQLGTAKVTVIGKNNFGGKLEETFDLLPCAPDSITARPFVNSPDSALTVSWTHPQASQVSVYKVELYDGEDKLKEVTTSGMQVTFGDLNRNKEYKFIITPGVNIGNVTTYGQTADPAFGTTAKTDLLTGKAITLSQTSYTYDGTAKTPAVTVAGVDASTYTVSYANNVNAGTATVTVTGSGDYKGTLTATFTIQAPATPDSEPGDGGSTSGGTTPAPGLTPTPTPDPGAGTIPEPGSGTTPTPDPGTGTTPDPGVTPTPNPDPGTGTIPEPGSGTTPTPDPGTGTTPDPGVTPTPTPDPEPEHQCTYKTTTTKATASKNGKIVTKCTVCGTVKSTTTIYKASGVKLKVASYAYNGKVKNPTVIVKDSKGKTIAKSNYTITKPTGRKAIGKYTYTIKFKGTKYTGTKKLTLTIKPVKPTIQTPKAAKKAITVKWKKCKKAQVTGYQVMVATNSKFTKNKKTATVKGYTKVSKKMTGLKAKTKYYVKVRTYKTVKGVKIYSNWSKVKTLKTK